MRGSRWTRTSECASVQEAGTAGNAAADREAGLDAVSERRSTNSDRAGVIGEDKDIGEQDLMEGQGGKL